MGERIVAASRGDGGANDQPRQPGDARPGACQRGIAARGDGGDCVQGTCGRRFVKDWLTERSTRQEKALAQDSCADSIALIRRKGIRWKRYRSLDGTSSS